MPPPAVREHFHLFLKSLRVNMQRFGTPDMHIVSRVSDGDPAVTLQMLAGANIDFPPKPLGTPEEEYRANWARASWLLDS